MTLFQRIFAEKRTLLTAVGAILAIDIGLYAFAIYPWSNKVFQAETRTTTAEAQVEEARAANANAAIVSQNKASADSQLERFYRDVLPTDLAGARLILSPFLDKLAEDSDLVLERSTSVPEKERESLLARLRTTMVLAGEYEDIRQFIYALETASEFILIEGVLLSQGDQDEADLVLTLELATYYWAGPDAES